jgi:AGCS family alanine or glycine:cation symporter
MDLFSFFKWLNDTVFAVPCTILFFGAGVWLTIKTGFLQIRGLPKFFSLITQGISRKKDQGKVGEMKTMDSVHALFTAMATTIGIGNVVSPSLAIMVGGPGALFWLLFYILIGSATKFTEVVFALRTRIKTEDGNIIGGPMQYLKGFSPFMAQWYGIAMAILMAGWSAVQTNTLASILVHESIPSWVTGAALALFVLVVLQGGAQRVGNVASKLVPIMFVSYVTYAVIILFRDFSALSHAVGLVLSNIFSGQAAMGGFAGVTLFQAMRTGIYRGIFITESGLGTSSIPHAMADAQKPTDQGLLAMFSAGADAFLSLLSGLIVLVTGVWMQGEFRGTLVYEAFKIHSPVIGRLILTFSIGLFALTTVMGNSFNGRQSFAAITNYRWVKQYMFFTLFMIFVGSQLHAKLVWEIMDTVLIFVAVPNLIGILYLAHKNPEVLKVR